MKTYILTLGLLSALIIAVFVILMQARENRYLKDHLPYLLPKEKIASFDLLGLDNQQIDVTALSGKPSLIFVFKSPCNACNQNVQFWKKIAKIMKGDVNVFGVVFSDYNQMVEFSQQSRINFKLYTPVEPEKFRRHMKLKLNIAQTILYHNDSVHMVKMGQLSGEDYILLLKKVKSLVRRTNT